MMYLRQIKINFHFSTNFCTFYWDYAIVLMKQSFFIWKSAVTYLRTSEEI